MEEERKIDFCARSKVDAGNRYRPSNFCRGRRRSSSKFFQILNPEFTSYKYYWTYVEARNLHSLLDFCGTDKAWLRGMKFVLTTHNVKLTKAIEDHILGRIEKLEHFDRWAVDARVNLEHDQTQSPEKQFKCSMRLGVRGPDLFAEDSESVLHLHSLLWTISYKFIVRPDSHEWATILL